MQTENWKDVPDYEGYYQASTLGNIRTVKRFKVDSLGRKMTSKSIVLKQFLNKSGYLSVGLWKNGCFKNYHIHKIIAITFLNHKKCKHKEVVDHINDIKIDNRLENLQLVTARFNTRKTQGNYSSIYKGVCWNKKLKKWISSIGINNKRIYLGLFINEIDASNAYQLKLKEHEGA